MFSQHVVLIFWQKPSLRMQVFLVGDLTGLYSISLEVDSVGGATKVPYKAALGYFVHMHNLNQNFSFGQCFHYV